MNENVLLGIIIVQTLLLAALFFRSNRSSEDAGSQMLKTDIDNLTKSVTTLKDGLTDKLGEGQKMLYEGMNEQFKESSKLIGDVTRNLTELKETNKQVVGVTDELKTLQNILQNPKQRGVLGEYFLETVLENILPQERYKMQYKFENGDIVDAIIKLDKDKILPIDSKFSLENYNRLIEQKDKSAREGIIKTFKADLKSRIDETSKYIRPEEGTLDYAFMFIPSEAIYYDLLANRIGEASTNSRDLLEYAFVDKKVIIVSPTTFAAYLQTVMQGLRSLQIEGQAKEIQKRVGQLGRHLDSYEGFMQRLGKSLSTTVNHYNSAHKELKKVDKDVVKIAEKAPSVEPLLVERPQSDDD